MDTTVPATHDSRSPLTWNARPSGRTSSRRRRDRPPGRSAKVPGTCALPAPRPRVIVNGSPRATLERLLSNARSEGRDRAHPALSLLVLGAEDTDTAGFARALARGLFGWESALVELRCGDYRDGVRVSRLLGDAAGDGRETSGSPLGQRRLDSAHLKAMVAGHGRVGENAGLPLRELNPSLVRPLSVVLFHEIEKAHPKLWDALLQILQSGRLVLGDGSVTSFAHSIVVMTSGVGGREISEVAGRRTTIRQDGRYPEDRTAELARVAGSATNGAFPADFLSRVDEVHVQGPTRRAALELAFDTFSLDPRARTLREGSDLVPKPSDSSSNGAAMSYSRRGARTSPSRIVNGKKIFLAATRAFLDLFRAPSRYPKTFEGQSSLVGRGCSSGRMQRDRTTTEPRS